MPILNLILQQVFKEMRTAPFTLMLLLGLTVWSLHSYHTSATESYVDQALTDLKNRVEANGKNIKRGLVLQYTQAIRGQYSQICITQDPSLKITLERILDGIQADYYDVTGEYFQLGPCI